MEDIKLINPPIVEAVVDLDCDLPPSLKLEEIEGQVKDAFKDKYPKQRALVREQHTIEILQSASPSPKKTNSFVCGFQCFHDDEKQLVQIKADGFSFNRLKPYTSLDDYLPEIQRLWDIYRKIALPIVVRTIRLRYINRIPIRFEKDQISVELDDYFNGCPQLPDESTMSLQGFLQQYAASEESTGHQINVVLTTQKFENWELPIILDIAVSAQKNVEPDNWNSIKSKIQSLRNLKNNVFFKTLTEKCRKQFQQP